MDEVQDLLGRNGPLVALGLACLVLVQTLPPNVIILLIVGVLIFASKYRTGSEGNEIGTSEGVKVDERTMDKLVEARAAHITMCDVANILSNTDFGRASDSGQPSPNRTNALEMVVGGLLGNGLSMRGSHSEVKEKIEFTNKAGTITKTRDGEFFDVDFGLGVGGGNPLASLMPGFQKSIKG